MSVDLNKHPYHRGSLSTPLIGDVSSQCFKELEITPSATEFSTYAKAVSVAVTNGGRAIITYLPAGNADGDTVTKEVPDGWVSNCYIRKVTTLTALAGETAVLTRLDD